MSTSMLKNRLRVKADLFWQNTHAAAKLSSTDDDVSTSLNLALVLAHTHLVV